MGETATGDVPDNCHPKIRRIYDYWLSIHPAADLPGRQHFDPLDVPLLLPNLCLIDAPTPSTDFTFRLMGTRLENFYGGDFTGKPFVSAYVKARQSRSFIDLCATQHDGLPRWRRGPAAFVQNREHVTIERVFLPLAGDGVTVDLILGLLLAKMGDTDFV